MDVARKLLILVREAGYKLEFKNIKVENLLPKECRDATSIDDFFSRLDKAGKYFEAKRRKAETQGKRLRYIARYENGKAKISLEAVGGDHPFYSLSSNDNIVAFTTTYYKRPMVIQGPGAGAEVTSGGVFADIIRISNYLI